jgi:hypothetical protein
MIWPRHKLDGRFTVDQIRFLNFKAVPGGYTVTTAGGQVVPPPPWSHLVGSGSGLVDGAISLLMMALFIPAGVVAACIEYGLHWWRTRK